MAYEPSVHSSFKKGLSGLATVMKSTDGKVFRVIMKVKKGEGEEEKKFDLPVDACPSNLRPGKWRVSMNGDNDKMMSFRPVVGRFTFVTKSFVAGKDDIPTPKTYTNPAHPDYAPYDYFDVLLTIVSPEKYKDIEVTNRFHYNFEPEMLDGKQVVAYSHGGSKYTAYLRDYLNVTGAWKLGPMDWKDNLLPDFQRRILHEDRKFEGTMKDGWIVGDSFLPIEEADDDTPPFDVDDNISTTTTPEFTSDEIDFEPEAE